MVEPGAGQALAAAVRAVHDELRTQVVARMAFLSLEQLIEADDSGAGDTIYTIDKIADNHLLALISQYMSAWLPVVVVAEGIRDSGHGDGVAILPTSASTEDAQYWLIIDPIDGTRGLMYAKRSAWILTGIARAESGSDKQPRLADIDVAVQTEIPIPKQNKADTLWAVRGCGAQAVRTDLTSGREHPISLRPSLARTLEHGFGQVMRAFPGGRDILAAVDDEICRQLGSTDLARKVISFEDQYISTGGQLAELSYGHDRWIADLRPLVNNALVDRGLNPILCCHPYDICSALIARECGVIVTEIGGGTLQASLNIYEDVAWVGYANNDLRATVEPALNSALRQFGLL